MTRTSLSRPVRVAMDDGLINSQSSVFDYGCGKGGDVQRLRDLEVGADGWDPHFRPAAQLIESDVVNLGYVVNVIEDPAERSTALRSAWALTRRVLVVAGRLVDELDPERLTPFADGWLTGNRTFQKFFEQAELRHWIDHTLEVEAVAAAPGVFYVFRNESDRQDYLALRASRRSIALPKRRVSDEVFEEHQLALQLLMDFVAHRGRLPRGTEVEAFRDLELALGSVRRAFRIVLWVTDEAEWRELARRRREDLLLYVGLNQFEGRPRFSQLPEALRHDVRTFFSSYAAACSEADQLLYSAGKLEEIAAAVRDAPFGKKMPSAFYVHASALDRLPPVLRAYEGCASAFIGSIEGADIIKLSLKEPRVSYLHYPRFDRDPHPALYASVSISLQTFRTRLRRYHSSDNPPILHRKELFVPDNYPGYDKFRKLTHQEERAGLYDAPWDIGTTEQWDAKLNAAGVCLRGHRLTKIP